MIRAITIATFLACTLGAFGQAPAFEVASVKPNQSGDGSVWRYGSSRGDVTATNVTLQLLITNAYDVAHHQISGGPDWVKSERFDVVTRQSGEDRTPARTRQMLQTLLADKFQLRLRREIQELPVYALVVGGSGPKLHEPDGAGQGNTTGRGRITARKVSMEWLARKLEGQLGRTVVDRTGVKGEFAFELEWEAGPPEPLWLLFGPSPAPVDPSGLAISTALREQLGLRLEPQRGPVELLVIDHAEKPSGN